MLIIQIRTQQLSSLKTQSLQENKHNKKNYTMGFFNLSTSTVAPQKESKSKNRSFFTSFMDSSPQIHDHRKKKVNPKEIAKQCCSEEYKVPQYQDEIPTEKFDKMSLEEEHENKKLPPSIPKTKKKTLSMSYLKCCPFDDVSALIDVDKFAKKNLKEEKQDEGATTTSTLRHVESSDDKMFEEPLEQAASAGRGGPSRRFSSPRITPPVTKKPEQDTVLFSSSILLTPSMEKERTENKKE